MTDLDDLIARLREATEGTTPGPWTLRRNAYDVLLMDAGDDVIMGNQVHEEWTPPETDWPFIAAARQLVPEAAAALEALRDEVARLRAEVEVAQAAWDRDRLVREAAVSEVRKLRAALKHQ